MGRTLPAMSSRQVEGTVVGETAPQEPVMAGEVVRVEAEAESDVGASEVVPRSWSARRARDVPDARSPSRRPVDQSDKRDAASR